MSDYGYITNTKLKELAERVDKLEYDSHSPCKNKIECDFSNLLSEGGGIAQNMAFDCTSPSRANLVVNARLTGENISASIKLDGKVLFTPLVIGGALDLNEEIELKTGKRDLQITIFSNSDFSAEKLHIYIEGYVNNRLIDTFIENVGENYFAYITSGTATFYCGEQKLPDFCAYGVKHLSACVYAGIIYAVITENNGKTKIKRYIIDERTVLSDIVLDKKYACGAISVDNNGIRLYAVKCGALYDVTISVSGKCTEKRTPLWANYVKYYGDGVHNLLAITDSMGFTCVYDTTRDEGGNLVFTSRKTIGKTPKMHFAKSDAVWFFDGEYICQKPISTEPKSKRILFDADEAICLENGLIALLKGGKLFFKENI